MLGCFKAKNPNLANDAWRAGVMPVFTLIIDFATKAANFILKAWHYAIMTYPAVEIKKGVWCLDPEAPCVTISIVTTFDKYRVQPVKAASPLRMKLKVITNGMNYQCVKWTDGYTTRVLSNELVYQANQLLNDMYIRGSGVRTYRSYI